MIMGGTNPGYPGRSITPPPPLLNNEKRNLHRLDSLVQKLEQANKYKAYDEIIQSQLKEGIIEPAPEESHGREFY